MITLYYFYSQSKKNNIPFKKIKFEKNDIDKNIKEFLVELLHHIGIFIYKIHQFHKYKKIDKKFTDFLSFIEDFYSFLKERQNEITEHHYILSSKNPDISEQIFAKDDAEKYYKKYSSATTKNIFKYLKLHTIEKTILFDECLSECFMACIKNLSLILFINNSVCKKEDIGDMLFNIQFELYSHVVPNHLEDLDSETPGLISQIKWLKKQKPLFNKTFVKNNIISLAKAILDSKIGIIEGARKIYYLLASEDLLYEKDFLIFTLVMSETDHLPIGAERGHWNSEALVKKDREIKKNEKFYKKDVLKACKKILQKCIIL